MKLYLSGLARHNYWRAKHNAGAMTWSDDLASTSAAWAKNQCGGLTHDDNPTGSIESIGENLGRGEASSEADTSHEEGLHPLNDISTPQG